MQLGSCGFKRWANAIGSIALAASAAYLLESCNSAKPPQPPKEPKLVDRLSSLPPNVALGYLVRARLCTTLKRSDRLDAAYDVSDAPIADICAGIKEVVDRGADPNAETPGMEGLPVEIVLAPGSASDDEIVQMTVSLVLAGAHLNSPGHLSPLCYAHHPSVITSLVRLGADPNWMGHRVAIRKAGEHLQDHLDSIDIPSPIEAIIEISMDPEEKKKPAYELRASDSDPLGTISGDDQELACRIQALIAGGANLQNHSDYLCGYASLLDMAVRKHFVAVAKVMMAHGADIEPIKARIRSVKARLVEDMTSLSQGQYNERLNKQIEEDRQELAYLKDVMQ